jgi:hypothetical protein
VALVGAGVALVGTARSVGSRRNRSAGTRRTGVTARQGLDSERSRWAKGKVALVGAKAFRSRGARSRRRNRRRMEVTARVVGSRRNRSSGTRRTGVTRNRT